jgi:zinc transporter ZupT
MRCLGEKSVLDLITAGFLASLAAGLATGLGALPALLFKKRPDRLLGAMLFVVFHEIIPGSQRLGYQRPATFSTLLGIIAMVTLEFLVSR